MINYSISKKARFFAVVLALVLAFSLAACGSKEDPKEEEDSTPESTLSGEIMIAAAASLENAFVQDLIPMFNKENPDVKITGTYDASGKLQTQIEEGLPAQIFFSAAKKQMTALDDGGFIDSGSITELLENEVVLITGTNTTTNVTSFDNITEAATIAIGDPASVPAGQYAQEVLTNLGTWADVEARGSLGTNVTEVLNWVAEGSAEVGIVYKTDAASMADKVKIIGTAPEGSLKTPVIYPIALLSNIDEGQKELATAFLDFLKSPEALAVFEKFGFKAA